MLANERKHTGDWQARPMVANGRARYHKLQIHFAKFTAAEIFCGSAHAKIPPLRNGFETSRLLLARAQKCPPPKDIREQPVHRRLVTLAVRLLCGGGRVLQTAPESVGETCSVFFRTDFYSTPICSSHI